MEVLIFKLLFKALILTTIIEIIISYILGIRNIKNIIVVAYVNFITNILLNVLVIFLNPQNTQIIILEMVIIVIEGFLYKNLFFYEDKLLFNKIYNRKILFILFSLILNLSSFFIGKILF